MKALTSTFFAHALIFFIFIGLFSNVRQVFLLGLVGCFSWLCTGTGGKESIKTLPDVDSVHTYVFDADVDQE